MLWLTKADWELIATKRVALSIRDLQKIRYSATRQGIPDSFRGRIWLKILDIDNAKEQHPANLYPKLCELRNNNASADIRKDVDRTLAQLGLWGEDLFAGNNKLYNVLMAYANFDQEVGYVQGINYIVAILLFYIQDEELVFWCLYQVMNKLNMRQVYKIGFPKLALLNEHMSERLQTEHPRLLEHLNEN